MPLDRQSIEKRDFPIGRRGYEPEAVDAHLAELAAQIEALQRSSARRSTESLAQAASEQVRTIVQAAESTAADIERSAEEEAARIRTEATRDAESARAEAVDQAREQVGQVSHATSEMLQRVDAMESELGALVESLRTGASRLNADLALLEGNLGELYRVAGAGRPAATDVRPASPPPARPTPEVESFDEPAAGAPARGADAAPAAAPAFADDDEDDLEDFGDTAAGDAGDVEGARLIALNMALNGQSREETDRYLAENFDLGDRRGLLDEVYASVGG